MKIALVLALGLSTAVPLYAQGGVGPSVLTLNQAQSHLDEGRIREARAELERWWALHQEEATGGELQRALWLRALMTVDPEIAEVDFRRLTLEFSGGPYAGGAQLRLAQAADARGDRDRAREHYQRLARDYPNGGLRFEALSWLERHGGLLPARERERVEAPPEEPTVRPDDTASAVLAASVLSVELGAFRDQRVATELRERALSAGLAPRIVPRPDGTFSVRVGRLRHRAEAVTLRDRALTAGFRARLIPAEPAARPSGAR